MVTLLLTKLWRDLHRQAAQFLAVVVIAMLGVALFGAANDAYLNLKSSYASLFDRLRFADLQVTGGDIAGFQAAVRRDPAVTQTQVRHTADLPFHVGGAHRFIGRLVGMPSEGQPSVDQVLLLRGRYLSPAQPLGVLAEEHFADHFHLGPGSQVMVRGGNGWQDLTVVGVVASAEYVWPARSRQDALTNPDDFGVLFTPDQLVTRIGGQTAQTQLLVYLDRAAAGGPALARLENQAAAFAPTDITDRANQPSNASLSEDIDGFGELAFLFPVLFLGAAAMTIYVLLTRLVHSQRAIIGTLLACGVRPRQLLLHYLSFGLAVGLAGGVLGAALGAALGGLLTDAYTSALHIPVALIALHPDTAATAVAMAVVVGGLAALAPALSALRTAPAEAMRGIAPTGFGRRSLPERLIPALSRLPAGWLLALRSVWRSPRRAVTTLVGVVLAATVILVSWGMLDSTEIVLQRQFHDVQRQDAIAYAADPGLLGSVMAVPGVSAAEDFAELPVTLRHGRLSYQTALEAFRAGTRMHGFYDLAGTRLQLPQSGIFVSSGLGQKLALQAGDRLGLQLTSVGRTVLETVVGFVDESVGSFAYITLGQLSAQLNGVNPVNAVLVKYAPSVNRQAMTEAIGRVPGIVVVVDSKATASAFSGQFLSLFYTLVGAMLIFGVALAGALIFSTVSVNILERSQEFATLLTSGVRMRQLAALVTAENLALTLSGLVPGLLIGYWAAGAFLSSFNSDLFHFDEYVLPRSYLIAAAAIVAAALASEVPGLRTIARIDLAAAVRERAA